MSNSDHHLVATGARVVDAMPLVERLLALSAPGAKTTVDIRVLTDSHASRRYREMLSPDANHELHIPAAHVAAFVAAYDPIITDPNRRRPELGVLDGDGGRWLSVHQEEVDLLAALPPVPVEIEIGELPVARFDAAVVPTEADHPVRASFEWSAFWPEVGEAGLPPHGKHAAVCLVVNGADPWDMPPAAPGYRLYVVTEDGGHRRAAHLASAAGLRLE